MHTVQSYLGDLEQFVGATWEEDVRLPVAWDHVDRYMARRFLVDCQKKGMKPSTTRRKCSSLRSFFKFLVRESVVSVNPFSGLALPKRTAPLPTFLSREDVVKLLEAPLFGWESGKEQPKERSLASVYFLHRDSAILEVLYSTGIRISELVGLKEEQVDLLSEVVKVPEKEKRNAFVPWAHLR